MINGCHVEFVKSATKTGTDKDYVKYTFGNFYIADCNGTKTTTMMTNERHPVMVTTINRPAIK